jgi:hypothetical protein
MIGEENPDPLGEYVKVCPYCGETFTAGHMNRKFCFEKNGFKDYCKNRYKRKINEELSSIEVRINTNEERYSIIENPETESAKETLLDITISLMEHLLNNQLALKLPLNHLSNLGASYEVYDAQYLMPGTELKVLTYGPYALAWGYENQLILTHKNQIPWIQ